MRGRIGDAKVDGHLVDERRIGQCHAEIPLPPGFWTPIRGDGAQQGWRYRDASASAQGVRSITIDRRKSGGQIRVSARGAFPCTLEAAQSGPVHVELRLSALRYCARFGGTIRANEAGMYRAICAPAPAVCLPSGVLGSQNVGQRQSTQREAADLQPAAARHAVRSGDRQHGENLGGRAFASRR